MGANQQQGIDILIGVGADADNPACGGAPALAQGQGGGPVTAISMLEGAAPHSPDLTPVYSITDEARDTSYELVSGFVDLEQ